MNQHKQKIVAVIAAGGSGKRMGQPKQMLMLDGQPILVRTIEMFKQVPAIDQILVATAKENFPKIKALVGAQNFAPICIEGGAERQDSVSNALKLVADDADIVLIHDGARPLVTIEIIERVIEAAQRHGAAVVGVPVKDTIKRVGDDFEIIDTLDRDQLWQAQTPQAFKWPILKEAYAKARDKATDDAKLVEDIGQKVEMIMGSYDNIKITTPEDLIMAEAICSNRQKKSS